MNKICSIIKCQVLANLILMNMKMMTLCYDHRYNVSAIFIFGDSLVEVGNNYYINALAKPLYPNGIDFAKGTPSGRYSNGRTVADFIEEELGFEYSPPYLAPNTTVDVILKLRGVNYASSGGTILNFSGTVFETALSMDEQLNYFSKTRQDIISRIGAPAAHALITNALYFLVVGANDILFHQVYRWNDTTYLDDVISTFKSQIIRLYNLEARRIAVTASPPVGCIPFVRDTRSAENCFGPLNDQAKKYNAKLRRLLQHLTPNILPGSSFVYIDNYAILDHILRNYEFNGFENAKSACCRVAGRRGGLIPCLPISQVCPNRSKYVFWDPFHPTERANLIAARHALDGGLRYVSPINIRQFAT